MSWTLQLYPIKRDRCIGFSGVEREKSHGEAFDRRGFVARIAGGRGIAGPNYDSSAGATAGGKRRRMPIVQRMNGIKRVPMNCPTM
jgi:hypothetical protein